MSLSIKIWVPISFIYILFFLWYTNLSGPLTDQEIETYEKIYEKSDSERRDSKQWKKAFKFMSEDDDKSSSNSSDIKESSFSDPASNH